MSKSRPVLAENHGKIGGKNGKEPGTGKAERTAQKAVRGLSAEDALYQDHAPLEVITSYYIRIKHDRDLHPDLMPGTVRLLVQLQHLAPMGIAQICRSWRQ